MSSKKTGVVTINSRAIMFVDKDSKWQIVRWREHPVKYLICLISSQIIDTIYKIIFHIYANNRR